MTTLNPTTRTANREQYVRTVQRDIERWRKGYEQMESEALPVSDEDRADLRRVWLELEAAYRDLQAADETQWEAMQRRSQRSAQTFRNSWLAIVTRIEVEDQSEIGWLRGFTDDLTTKSSDGWLEGMAEEPAESEGWTEGYAANRN